MRTDMMNLTVALRYFANTPKKNREDVMPISKLSEGCLVPQLSHRANYRSVRLLSKMCNYRGTDKSLARPGRKQATATEDFDFHIPYL